MTTSITQPRRVLTRASGMLVAAVAAGTPPRHRHGRPRSRGSFGAPCRHRHCTVRRRRRASGFTSEEPEQAAGSAMGIAELGVTVEQFAAAIKVSLTGLPHRRGRPEELGGAAH